MKRWVVFLIVPVFLIWIFQIISAFILGVVLGLSHTGFFAMIATFFLHFVGGLLIFGYAPGKNSVLAFVYGFCYSSFLIYSGVSDDGSTYLFMGEVVKYEFSWLQVIIEIVAIFLGIAIAAQSEKQQYGD